MDEWVIWCNKVSEGVLSWERGVRKGGRGGRGEREREGRKGEGGGRERSGRRGGRDSENNGQTYRSVDVENQEVQEKNVY